MAYLDVVRGDRPHFVWPLWEGGMVHPRDMSGNGRHGASNGSPTYRAGASVPGYAGIGLGAGNYVESVSSLTLGSALSLECWFVKRSHLAGYPGDINSLIGDLFSASNGALVRWDGATALKFYWASAGSYGSLTASDTPALGSLCHLVASATSSGRARMVINGNVVGDASAGTVSGFSGGFRVGRSEDGRYFGGGAGFAAAYNYELPVTVARAHWLAGIRGGGRLSR